MAELPRPTDPLSSRREVFLTYLDYFRSAVVDRVRALGEEARESRLPTGWSPLELARHLTYVERRWLEWGFLGEHLEDPWADQRDGRWFVEAGASLDAVLAALLAQGVRSSAIIGDVDLDAVGRPSPRWEGDDPPTLERILFHLLQEYARHLGHLDIVVELAGGAPGE